MLRLFFSSREWQWQMTVLQGWSYEQVTPEITGFKPEARMTRLILKNKKKRNFLVHILMINPTLLPVSFRPSSSKARHHSRRHYTFPLFFLQTASSVTTHRGLVLSVHLTH